MTIRLVQPVERVGGRSHVEHRKVLVNILRNEELDGVSEEQVDILDEVKQVVPCAVLRGRRIVRQVTLDCRVSYLSRMRPGSTHSECAIGR